MSKLYGILLFLLVADYASSVLTNTYIFEFGQNIGTLLTRFDGTIPFLQYSTEVDLDVPSEDSVEYVKVIVHAVSPPKVDYNSEKRQVTIAYAWSQVSYSTYTIIVKGYIQ
ncbi:uncharacterized protein LOC123875167 [Maniola jurtina]|uniref:uncharacterized protein LOC123875167 n=1 Tax=Maniola jurtina TaxID=191418 RepID=UPI001E685EA9|nr:uncharacterized protein LOC123875167 [Maniola jurtina]